MNADYYDTLRADKVKLFFPGDHTHTNPAGAELNVASMIEGLKQLPNCLLCADFSATGAAVGRDAAGPPK